MLASLCDIIFRFAAHAGGVNVLATALNIINQGGLAALGPGVGGGHGGSHHHGSKHLGAGASVGIAVAVVAAVTAVVLAAMCLITSSRHKRWATADLAHLPSLLFMGPLLSSLLESPAWQSEAVGLQLLGWLDA